MLSRMRGRCVMRYVGWRRPSVLFAQRCLLSPIARGCKPCCARARARVVLRGTLRGHESTAIKIIDLCRAIGRLELHQGQGVHDLSLVKNRGLGGVAVFH